MFQTEKNIKLPKIFYYFYFHTGIVKFRDFCINIADSSRDPYTTIRISLQSYK